MIPWSSGKDGEEVLYGTADGKLGLVRITKSGASTSWELDNEKKKGGRTLLLVLDKQIVSFQTHTTG